ncbi:hypothetical protein Taro_009027, partial [Colocasia esculenta]|nr:hypothetical protein [Colocasia esculenta]
LPPAGERATTAKGKRGSSGDRARTAKGQAVTSPAEVAEKAVAGRLRGGTCGEGAVSGLGQVTTVNLQAANLRRQQGNSGHPFLLPLFLRMSSTPPGVSCRPHHLLPPPLRSGCEYIAVKKRSETNKQNKTKHTFFHYTGSKSFADIYHDEDKIRNIKLTQQSTTSSSIASVGDAYEQVMGRDRTGRICGIGTGPTPKSLWGSRSEQKLRQDNESLKEKIEALEERMKKIESRGNNESSTSVCHAQKKKDSMAGRRVGILNFSGEVVASGILISDDNDNVVMGKKLGGEYYEEICLLKPVILQGQSKLFTNLLSPHVNNFIY